MYTKSIQQYNGVPGIQPVSSADDSVCSVNTQLSTAFGIINHFYAFSAKSKI